MDSELKKGEMRVDDSQSHWVTEDSGNNTFPSNDDIRLAKDTIFKNEGAQPIPKMFLIDRDNQPIAFIQFNESLISMKDIVYIRKTEEGIDIDTGTGIITDSISYEKAIEIIKDALTEGMF